MNERSTNLQNLNRLFCLCSTFTGVRFFDFDLIRLPDPADTTPLDKSGPLLLYPGGEAAEERVAFLENVLRAAGYSDPAREVNFIACPSGAALDLATLLLRQSKKTERIIIFGIEPRTLGLHFQLAAYHPVRVNDRTYLLADDPLTIRDEKTGGKTQKAAALWRAVKAAFLPNDQ